MRRSLHFSSAHLDFLQRVTEKALFVQKFKTDQFSRTTREVCKFLHSNLRKSFCSEQSELWNDLSDHVESECEMFKKISLTISSSNSKFYTFIQSTLLVSSLK